MGSKLRGDGVEFPDGSLQTTAATSSISTMQIFYASTTFNKPAGVTRLEVTLVGGGASAGPLEYTYANTYYGSVPVNTTGYPEFFGSPTSIIIEGTTHKARGGWIRTDLDSVVSASLNIHEKYGGQTGYLGEKGFAGKTDWAGNHITNAGGGGFGSYPEYPEKPLAFGGSGYGYEGGSYKQYVDTGNSFSLIHADSEGWAGGAGSYNTPWAGNPLTTYLNEPGNGGGYSLGSLGGSRGSGITSEGHTVYGSYGALGGGGGFSINPVRLNSLNPDGTYGSNSYSGGGGGGAGAGGGGGSSSSGEIYGGAAGQVVTFQIDVPSLERTGSNGYSIVIGTGGDGLLYRNVIGGGGGQGVVIIKY